MPLSESTDANAAANESLPAREKIDTEQQHKFSVENFKNNVASQFLNVCLLGLLILAILDFFQRQRRRTVQWRGSVENTRHGSRRLPVRQLGKKRLMTLCQTPALAVCGRPGSKFIWGM